ncbi:DUF559 domain-containing protein [Vulcaniibacterium tengchongense]|uniref:DUF559 domain-containing protein n=1 Tax=Vulcaniibacterium tengchongense TaxID=1273429 RepID=UPI0024111DAD|nr:DUF559 domain-containing protein [Vulcaniibacterium tengchongense]
MLGDRVRRRPAQRRGRRAGRTAFLERQGYRVLGFWNNDALARTGGVLQAILAALLVGPHPNPPPASGRGVGGGTAVDLASHPATGHTPPVGAGGARKSASTTSPRRSTTS